MTEPNPWLEKAKALDQYRWQLLRQRHGFWGSLGRFIREACLDGLTGLLTQIGLLHQSSITGSPCDFLLLQSAPKVIALNRKKWLIAALQDKGYNLKETALLPFNLQYQQKAWVKPPYRVPLRYLSYAAHAQWIVAQHAPRVLLNDRNGSLYSPFLRLALHTKGSLLVHLAHATTLESSRRLSMNDYDHYFVFGQSSLEALQQRAPRFGSSQVVLAGSHMINQDFDLPPAHPALKTLLILGVGPDKEKESGYQETYTLLRDWAAQNPDFQVKIKSHPRSARSFWQAAAQSLPNLELLPADCPLAEALKQSSLVINIMSNAIIEAALAKRPVLYVNLCQDPDIFQQERFFGDCIQNTGVLTQRIQQIQADYPRALQASADFAQYHLAQGCQGLEHTLSLLEQLYHTGQCPGTPLPAKASTR